MAAPTLRGRERFSLTKLMVWDGGSLGFREDIFGSSSKGASPSMSTSAESSPEVIFVGPRRVLTRIPLREYGPLWCRRRTLEERSMRMSYGV